jgi:L,D-transpeptidase ErfK/SrfK
MKQLLGAALAASLCAAPGFAQDVIGAPESAVAHAEDTLLDIAVAHDVGYLEIVIANPGIDPWLPRPGAEVMLPTAHLVPAAPRRGIVINLAELRLYWFPPGGPPRSYPIGVGDIGKATPLGVTTIIRKTAHPTWTPTASERAEHPDLPAVVAAGPDNPMGEWALYLGWPLYAIHGTDTPYSIGRRGTHGCIRLYADDIAALFAAVPVGTPVRVVDQTVKLGRIGDELYVEIHPPQDDDDVIEQTGKAPSPPADIDELVRQLAGADIDRIDWDWVHRAATERRGMPVRITRPSSESAAQVRFDWRPPSGPAAVVRQ